MGRRCHWPVAGWAAHRKEGNTTITNKDREGGSKREEEKGRGVERREKREEEADLLLFLPASPSNCRALGVTAAARSFAS